MSGWSKAWLPELAILGSGPTWFPIRRHFGIAAFGINAWGADEGQELVSEHDELGASAQQHEELYVVLSGDARFTVDGEEVEAPAGTLVFVPDPASKRQATASADGTVVLVAGAKPGEPFRPGVWETNVAVFPLFDQQRYDEIEAIIGEALREHPEHPGLLYNLACAASLKGDRERALDLLERSVSRDARFAEHARDDADFDPIRDDPRFAEVTR